METRPRKDGTVAPDGARSVQIDIGCIGSREDSPPRGSAAAATLRPTEHRRDAPHSGGGVVAGRRTLAVQHTLRPHAAALHDPDATQARAREETARRHERRKRRSQGTGAGVDGGAGHRARNGSGARGTRPCPARVGSATARLVGSRERCAPSDVNRMRSP
jgi:hypothetical protein